VGGTAIVAIQPGMRSRETSTPPKMSTAVWKRSLRISKRLKSSVSPPRIKEYPTLPTTSKTSGSTAAHCSDIVTDTTRLIKR